MAWEERNSRRYFYRGRRTADGRVEKKYYGTGELAKHAALAVAEAAQQRQEERRRLLAEQVQTTELETLMGRIGDVANVLLEATLISLGFRRTNFGPWRRQRAKSR